MGIMKAAMVRNSKGRKSQRTRQLRVPLDSTKTLVDGPFVQIV
jgi:hypothetical protein